MALRVCACVACDAHPGSCPELVTKGRCGPCAGQAERKRGTRQQRGYDAAYDRARRHWAPKVARGEVDCHAPTCLAPVRRLLPGEAWDLGHDDQRRIRGPEHSACNRSAGGKAAHQ